MKTPRIVSLLAALSFTTAAFAEGPAPGGDQPPGPPPPPRGNEGPHGRGEQGPGPRREHGPHHAPQQGVGNSAEKREHIEEALKHLRAAGLGHMAERIQQALKNPPQGPQDQQNRRDFRRGPRSHDRRHEGPWQSHAGPRQFRHPHLPYGHGHGFGAGRDGQPGPYARPNFQGRGERRQRGFAPQQPSSQGSGDNDLRAEVQQLKRAVEELRRALPNRDTRAEGPGPAPDRQRRPDFDRKDEPRREPSRDNDRRDDGPRGDAPRPDGPRNDGPPGERL